MVIQVSPDIEASIRERVESGAYEDATDVIRKALRALESREQRIREIRASIDEGIAAIERGEGREWTPELRDEINREADERIRLARLPDPDVCP
jgi:antitoxin ParD1/3/4